MQTLCMANYYLYVLFSRHHRHLNIGVTTDLFRGINSHCALVNRRLKKKRAPRHRLNRMIESVNPGWDSISLKALESTGFSVRKA